MNDHAPLVLTSFRGTYDRGEEDAVLPGYFRTSQNVQFINKGVRTRFGSSLDVTMASVRRIAVYERIGEAIRLLILDSSGQLFDSLHPMTSILSIPAMTDFSMVTMFNRAYITPHDGVTGLPGEKVYVYEGSGQARPAGGKAPATGPLVGKDSTISGHVEKGIHGIAVCYQTISGFITAPGGFTTVSSAGALKLDVSNIPTGPAGTMARVLVATKLLASFDGNFAVQTYYFIPNGTIGDNVATTYTVDFYDADLEDESSYLLEQLPEIPAGVGIATGEGRLVIWGEDLNSSIIRVSKNGDPESHNDVEGFITVNPGDAGGGVTNVCEYRSQMVIFKTQRTYAVQPTDDPPANWHVEAIDGSAGTTPHGLGLALNHQANIEDRLFLASRSGFRIFLGTFSIESVLSTPIEDIWKRINPDVFHKLEVAVDPINYVCYITVPLDLATEPDTILVCDYSEGITQELVKWTIWKFPDAAHTIVTDVVGRNVTLKFGSLAGNVYKIDRTSLIDYGTAIEAFIEFPPFPNSDAESNINNYIGIRLRAKGAGTLLIGGLGTDKVASFSAESISISAAPGRQLFSGFNFNDENCAVMVYQNAASGFFIITEIYNDRPRVGPETRPRA
jgi:hypothetical protein